MVSYSFYESDTRMLQYAAALTGRGDSVDVIALRRDGTTEFEVVEGANVYRIQRRAVNERSRFAYLIRYCVFCSSRRLFSRGSICRSVTMSSTSTLCRTSWCSPQ